MAYQIFVKTATLIQGGRTRTLDVSSTDSMYRVKEKLMEKVGLIPNQMNLGYRYQDSRSLSDYNIQNERTLTARGRFGGHFGVVIQINDDSQYKFIPHDFAPNMEQGQTMIQLKIKIAQFLDQDKEEFCKIYCLYDQYELKIYGEQKLSDSFVYTPPNNRNIMLGLKTKQGNLWYIEHQNEIKKHKFNLLVFGFVHKIEKEYEYRIPSSISKICEEYITWIVNRSFFMDNSNELF